MMVKEIIMLIAAVVGLAISLRKMQVVCTIISSGMLAGIALWLLGVETIETSFYFGFVFLAFLMSIFGQGIPANNRAALAIISLFVFLAEIALFMDWSFEAYLRYGMIIPIIVYIVRLNSRQGFRFGLGCATIMTVDATYIFIDSIIKLF
jgi:hypothetical protein